MYLALSNNSASKFKKVFCFMLILFWKSSLTETKFFCLIIDFLLFLARLHPVF